MLENLFTFDQVLKLVAIGATVGVGLPFAGIIVWFLLLLIVPGRKGFLRKRIELKLPHADIHDVSRRLTANLERHRFEVERSSSESEIIAKRPEIPSGTAEDGLEEVKRLSMLPLRANLRIRQQGAYVLVRGMMQIEPKILFFIFFDSGEGAYIRNQLSSVLALESSEYAPKPVTVLPLLATSSLFTIFLGWILLTQLRAPWLEDSTRRLGFLIGLQINDLFCVALAMHALGEIRKHPTELRGESVVYLTRASAWCGTISLGINLIAYFWK